MKIKICTKCHKEKELSEFSKDKSHKDGYSSICKICRNEEHKNYVLLHSNKINKHKKEYYYKFPWKLTFQNIIQRCENLNHPQYKDYGERGIQCLITEDELKELWFRDKAYLLKQPSINRKDNDGNYTFDNCEFIELNKNIAERNTRVLSKPVLQYDLNGKIIKEWNSATEASRELNIKLSNISSVALNRKSQSAGGFKWKYKLL